MALQPSKPRAVPRGVACRSLPSDSQSLCRRPRNPHSRDAAGRAGTVAGVMSPCAAKHWTLPRLLLHRSLLALAADVTPPIPVAALAALLATLLLFFPFGIAVVVTFGEPPIGCCAAAPPNTPRPQLHLNLVLQVAPSCLQMAPSCLQMAAPLAPWSPYGDSHSRHRTSLPAWSEGCQWLRPLKWSPWGGPCLPLQPSPRGLSSPAPTSLSVERICRHGPHHDLR